MTWISERAEMVRTIFWRPWVKLLLAAWSILTAYDLLISQVVPSSLADRAPKLRDLVAETSGWLPLWGWLLILSAILIGQLFEFAVAQLAEQRGRAHAASAKLVSPYADSTPDIRVADDPASLGLFDAPERDKLMPLLEAGRIEAWGRAGTGFPPLTKIPPDLWPTHFPLGQTQLLDRD